MSQARHLLQQRLAENVPQKKKQREVVRKRILERLFPAQYDFVYADKSRFKAALCPRRAGKSFAVLSAALYKLLSIPNAKVLVLGQVKGQTEAVYWSLLKQLDREFELGGKFRENHLDYTLPDGGRIKFSGAGTRDEIDKLRGQSFHLVCIDEGKSYSSKLLTELVDDIIMPALSDTNGDLLMIGTPGAILEGFFYDVTTANRFDKNGKPQVMRWSERDEWKQVEGKRKPWFTLHKWNAKDNVANPDVWKNHLFVKEVKGYADDHPTWMREYLGEWVPDVDAMVYAYSHANQDGKCDWEPDYAEKHFGLPKEHRWRFLMGIDFGSVDPTAFVLAAWSDTSPHLYYCYVEKHQHMTVDQIAERGRAIEEQFGVEPDIRVADTGALGKMVAHTMSQTYGYPCVPAKKTEKADFIKIMNSEMTVGRIKVPTDSELAEEWRTLQWADANPQSTQYRRREDPSLQNHAADAALYLWRYAYHHWSRTVEVEAEPGSKEWWKKREREEYKAFCKQQQEKEKPLWKKYRGRSWTSRRSKSW